MKPILNFPILLFTISLAALWLAARAGWWFRRRLRPLDEAEWEDFNLIITATLTLLGLLIGFSFSMAVSRYDQRKNLEEEEANAIGTEYLRVDFLPVPNAEAIRQLLLKYLDQRLLFYTAIRDSSLPQINAETEKLQSQLWSEVRAGASQQSTATVALAISGMNDVLNSQGYTQAAWWNRIPRAAWILMITIAFCSNMLVGYASRRSGAHIFWALPLALSVSFLLIADIESPRGGMIRVRPQNLISLSQSLKGQ